MWQYIPGQFCGGGVVAVKIKVLKMHLVVLRYLQHESNESSKFEDGLPKPASFRAATCRMSQTLI